MGRLPARSSVSAVGASTGVSTLTEQRTAPPYWTARWPVRPPLRTRRGRSERGGARPEMGLKGRKLEISLFLKNVPKKCPRNLNFSFLFSLFFRF